MGRFMYKARNNRGELATGIVQAASVDAASRMLRDEGKFVVRIDPVNEAHMEVKPAQEHHNHGRVGRQEVMTFAHQMAVMIETGVPLSEALDCVVDQCSDEDFKAVLTDVAEQVQAGGELSAAMRCYPRVFPTVMTSLIRASEMSGTMGIMLERVSQYLAKEHQTTKKIRAALVYPTVMLGLVVAVTVFLLVFVMPRFAGIYQTRGAALPIPTQMLMTLSTLLVDYWYVWIAGLMLMASIMALTLRTPMGRRLKDFAKLNTPIIGPLYRKLYITRGCRTMGTMLNAGVPILDMVVIVKEITNNVFYEDLWDEVGERLRQGSQLSDALFTSPLIPRSVAQMVYSGEKAGRLGAVMDRIAAYTEEEFDDQVRQATQFIEPALIAVMGSIIGFVAIALLLPIFTIGRVMSG